LQGCDIVSGEEGIVVFLEADAGTPQLPFHERMAVEPVGGVKRKETGDPADDRPQHLVADVEVVVREAAPMHRQDTVIGTRVGYLGTVMRKVRPCSMLLKIK
jgi:hypothetical protein